MRKPVGVHRAPRREEGLRRHLPAVEGEGVGEQQRAAVEVAVDLLQCQHVQHGRLCPTPVGSGSHPGKIAAALHRPGGPFRAARAPPARGTVALSPGDDGERGLDPAWTSIPGCWRRGDTEGRRQSGEHGWTAALEAEDAAAVG